ncbi:Hypothetical_protein [Hexamita inflata]|uniref:Hypothetical_protein n=1 Tax=Hexamita inflata TaxID=28002 RepID=A0AA86TQP4_9EUKA|nr:Hypothetical protein HINF_LOCUS12435 [Hexamita inflata]
MIRIDLAKLNYKFKSIQEQYIKVYEEYIKLLKLEQQVTLDAVRSEMQIPGAQRSNYLAKPYYENNKLRTKEILIVVYILAVHFCFLVLYWIWTNLILKQLMKKIKEHNSQMFKKITLEDEIEV